MNSCVPFFLTQGVKGQRNVFNLRRGHDKHRDRLIVFCWKLRGFQLWISRSRRFLTTTHFHCMVTSAREMRFLHIFQQQHFRGMCREWTVLKRLKPRMTAKTPHAYILSPSLSSSFKPYDYHKINSSVCLPLFIPDQKTCFKRKIMLLHLCRVSKDLFTWTPLRARNTSPHRVRRTLLIRFVFSLEIRLYYYSFK